MSEYSSIFRDGLFSGQLCVVTGGGSGIGRCAAHELAALGARVVLVGRKLPKLERVRAEAVIAANLTGGFLMAREVFTQSMSMHGGAIVNMVADMWNGMPGLGHSGAARAGMVNLTKTAAFDWAPCQVRVNTVAPGYIASSGLDNYEGPVRELIGTLKDHVPARRLGTEAEVSAAICFLLSPAAAFISGVTLASDGGAPLGTPLFPHTDHAPMPAFDGFHLSEPPAVLRGKAEDH